MARILLIETATKACSVGLAVDGVLTALREDLSEGYTHAERSSVFIDEVCREAGIKLADLDAVAVGSGPGSYTGSRIGASLAKGLCYPLHLPLIAIPTLQNIAQGVLHALGGKLYDDASICAMIDARRNEVFQAEYDADLRCISGPVPAIIDRTWPQTLSRKAIIVAGDGAFKVDPEQFPDLQIQQASDQYPSAKHMVSLANDRFEHQQFEDLAYFAPYYGKAARPIPPKER